MVGSIENHSYGCSFGNILEVFNSYKNFRRWKVRLSEGITIHVLEFGPPDYAQSRTRRKPSATSLALGGAQDRRVAVIASAPWALSE